MKKTNRLRERADALGYSGPSDFASRSGVPVSFESVRLGIYEGRTLSAPVMVLLLKYLQFSRAEIAEYLRAMGDKEYSELIDGEGRPAPEWEKVLLSYIERLRSASPGDYNRAVDVFVMACKGSGIVVDEKDEKKMKMKG